MLNKLRKKLIFLFVGIMSLLVTVIVLAGCIINIIQVISGNKESYLKNLDAVVKEIGSSKHIKDSWLQEMEIANRLVISIWDSGSPLFYRGSWMKEKQRETLLAEVMDKASKEAVDVLSYPEAVREIRSSIYSLNSREGERLYGAAVVLPGLGRYKSMVILGQFPREHRDIFRIVILALFIELLSIALLFPVSFLLVGHALRPVEINQKRQKEFIAAASHEIRSPLAVIRTNASALLVGEADLGIFVQGIQNECTRMARLTEDMMALSLSDNKSWSLKKELLDMNLFLIELYEAYFALLREKGQGLHLEFREDSLPKLKADRQRLRQICSILLDNAMHYAPEHTDITIRAGTKAGAGKPYFTVEIEDHGPGVPEQDKERIFERFYRGDKSRTEKGHFGLGLSIAKELVRLHEGRLTVKATEGGGATFLVDLPLS